MNKMTRVLFQTIIAINAIAVIPTANASTSSEDQFNVFIYAVLGPMKTSADYPAWSTNIVWELYQNHTITNNINRRLTASDITQETPSLTNYTLWFAVRITSKDPTKMLPLNQLLFLEKSSDTQNRFTNTYDLSTINNIVYDERALGVIWGAGGPRSSDTILNYNDGTILVNEINFVGMESPYFQYSLSTISNFIGSFTNFLITATCQVVKTGGIIVAKAQKTLQTIGSPLPPVMSIIRQDNIAFIGFNMETNRTAVIRSSIDPSLPFASWSLEATVNASDLLLRTETGPHRFYRALVE